VASDAVRVLHSSRGLRRLSLHSVVETTVVFSFVMVSMVSMMPMMPMMPMVSMVSVSMVSVSMVSVAEEPDPIEVVVCGVFVAAGLWGVPALGEDLSLAADLCQVVEVGVCAAGVAHVVGVAAERAVVLHHAVLRGVVAVVVVFGVAVVLFVMALHLLTSLLAVFVSLQTAARLVVFPVREDLRVPLELPLSVVVELHATKLICVIEHIFTAAELST